MKECCVSEIFCMGTNITQKVYGDNCYSIVAQVENEMRIIEASMSFFLQDSEISKINLLAGREYSVVNKDVFEVIKKAKYLSEVTNGCFDITSAPLIKLWGIFTKNAKVPLESEIRTALELVNYKDILLDEEKHTVMLLKRGQKIDLGAIAKGFAADRAIEIYQKNGIESAMVNLGGNVKVLGCKPDGNAWVVGIQNPEKKRGDLIGGVEVTNKTVVTSGDYVRCFENDNQKYHHIFDLQTGYPSDSNLSSFTIIMDKSMDADALSTSIFVMGIDKGMELLRTIKGADGIFITKDKQVITTDGIRKNLIFLKNDNGYRLI